MCSVGFISASYDGVKQLFILIGVDDTGEVCGSE